MNPKLSVVSIAFRLNARLKVEDSDDDILIIVVMSQLPFG